MTFLAGLLLVVSTACAPGSSTPLPATRAEPTSRAAISTSPGATSTPAAGAPRAGTATPEPPPANHTRALAGLGDPFYPLLGNAGYDVQRYTIDLDVDVASNTLTGTTTITALATLDLAAFHLDFAGLALHSVRVDGVPASFARAGSELIITPTVALAQGTPFIVTAEYGGTPQPILDPSVPSIPLGWLRQPDGLFVVSEPSGAMTWFPGNNHPSDKASYTFRITVPKPYQVAANGVLTGTADNGTTTTYTWEMTDPMASYLATVHIAKYTIQEQSGPHGLPVRNYFPTGTPASVQAGFAATPDMIAFLEGFIGPYPFDAYGVVLLNDNVGWALETQALSTFGAQGAGEDTVMHELVHQWFGNDVSPATWRDVWLNEGLATYFALLWTNRNARPNAIDLIMQQWDRRMQVDRMGSAIPNSPAEMFGPAVYRRGAWVLHTLRRQVGDDKFFAILRTYHQRHAGGSASTQDFIDIAAEFGGTIDVGL